MYADLIQITIIAWKVGECGPTQLQYFYILHEVAQG